MFTIGLAMNLRPGAFGDYKRAHDELWPELAASMRKHQVSMAIYRDGERLFLFGTAPSESDWQLGRKDPILERWDAEMTRFLESDPQGHIAFSLLPKAFGFGEFV